MTDNEIIKAFEYCNKLNCNKCDLKTRFKTATNCRNDLLANTLDLINRQKAEIERLKIETESIRMAANSSKMHYNNARAEALKEFLQKIRTQKWNYGEEEEG